MRTTTQGTGAGAVKEHGKRPGNWAGVEFMVEFVLSIPRPWVQSSKGRKGADGKEGGMKELRKRKTEEKEEGNLGEERRKVRHQRSNFKNCF